MTREVKIDMDGAGIGTIMVDGQNIANGCVGMALDLEPNRIPRIQLDLRIYEHAELVLADPIITIPDATRDALIALGWTPPDTDTFAHCDIDIPAGDCVRTDGHDGPHWVQAPDYNIGGRSSTGNVAPEEA